MFTLLFVAVALATVAVASSASPEERAEQLLSEMTFEEKVTMM